jgi:hypothetical protein
MTDAKAFFERVHEVTEFCMAHAGKCFGGWPRETVFLYVGFHALAGSIFVMRRNGHIAAVGFAWTFEPGTSGHEFNWGRPVPGEALMVREVIGHREACRRLFKQAREKWPAVKRFFAYRHRGARPVLVEFNPSTIERFCS